MESKIERCGEGENAFGSMFDHLWRVATRFQFCIILERNSTTANEHNISALDSQDEEQTALASYQFSRLAMQQQTRIPAWVPIR